MFVTDDSINNFANILKVLHPYLTPFSVLTGIFLFGWRAHTFLSTLVNNHLSHAKQDIINAVVESSKAKEIIEAVKENGTAIAKASEKEQSVHEKLVEAVNHSSDRIIDTLITLNRK